MGKRVSTEEGIRRLRILINTLRQGGTAIEVGKAGISGCALMVRALETQGFLKITNPGRRQKYYLAPPDKFDDDTLELLAREIWVQVGNQQPVLSKELRAPRELKVPCLPVNLHIPTFPNAVTTERISLHLAEVAKMLGIQFDMKTPPGMAQYLHTLRQQLEEAKKENVRLTQELTNAQEQLQRTARIMSREAQSLIESSSKEGA
jgi:hypothetical protein